MQIRTTNIQELRGEELANWLGESHVELWEEIRKRMPGVRVGRSLGNAAPLLYYTDELYARGTFGYSAKNFGDARTFYIQGPFISKGRAGYGERERLRSKSAATLARKAKKELRAWGVLDRAKAMRNAAAKLSAAKTDDEEKLARLRGDARRLLFTLSYGGATPAFLNALRYVEIPDQNVQHAVRVLIEEHDEQRASGGKPEPVYVAAYEHRGVPVYDYYDYNTPQVNAEAAPQSSMPTELYERLSVLNITEVNDVVPHIGVKASDFEFVLFPPKQEEK